MRRLRHTGNNSSTRKKRNHLAHLVPETPTASALDLIRCENAAKTKKRCENAAQGETKKAHPARDAGWAGERASDQLNLSQETKMPDFGLFCSIWGDTHFEKEKPKIKLYA